MLHVEFSPCLELGLCWRLGCRFHSIGPKVKLQQSLCTMGIKACTVKMPVLEALILFFPWPMLRRKGIRCPGENSRVRSDRDVENEFIVFIANYGIVIVIPWTIKYHYLGRGRKCFFTCGFFWTAYPVICGDICHGLKTLSLDCLNCLLDWWAGKPSCYSLHCILCV